MKHTNKTNLRSAFLEAISLTFTGIAMLFVVILAFIWKYRKTIIATLLIVATILLLGTAVVMGYISVATGLVEESGYRNNWQSIDVEDYEHLMAFRSNFAAFNPIAAWLYSMGATVLSWFARLAILISVPAITIAWIDSKPKKIRRRVN